MTIPNSEHHVEQSTKSPKPRFRELLRKECEGILQRNNVGRIAFTLHDGVDIEPLHYVFDGGWIYGRTSLGAKLATVAHHRWVAFEVDEVKDLFDWRSVVVKGSFYVLEADTPMHRDQGFNRGVELLRSLLAETLTADDPAPFRRSVFRIHLDEVSGREASCWMS